MERLRRQFAQKFPDRDSTSFSRNYPTLFAFLAASDGDAVWVSHGLENAAQPSTANGILIKADKGADTFVHSVDDAPMGAVKVSDLWTDPDPSPQPPDELPVDFDGIDFRRGREPWSPRQLLHTIRAAGRFSDPPGTDKVHVALCDRGFSKPWTALFNRLSPDLVDDSKASYEFGGGHGAQMTFLLAELVDPRRTVIHLREPTPRSPSKPGVARADNFSPGDIIALVTELSQFCSVINLSQSTPGAHSNWPAFNGCEAVREDILRLLAEHECTLVLAAGNTGLLEAPVPKWPGFEGPWVKVVGMATWEGEKSRYSHVGQVYVPGENVVSVAVREERFNYYAHPKTHYCHRLRTRTADEWEQHAKDLIAKHLSHQYGQAVDPNDICETFLEQKKESALWLAPDSGTSQACAIYSALLARFRRPTWLTDHQYPFRFSNPIDQLILLEQRLNTLANQVNAVPAARPARDAEPADLQGLVDLQAKVTDIYNGIVTLALGLTVIWFIVGLVHWDDLTSANTTQQLLRDFGLPASISWFLNVLLVAFLVACFPTLVYFFSVRGTNQ